MYSSTLGGIVYGIISTFIVALITCWIARLNIKSDNKEQQPKEIAHH